MRDGEHANPETGAERIIADETRSFPTGSSQSVERDRTSFKYCSHKGMHMCRGNTNEGHWDPDRGPQGKLPEGAKQGNSLN